MISATSRDARKELGLNHGVGGGKREMEESELEEGEAFSYQNHEHYDSSIDPDVALSYIDEKIQVVLGHFQKDFEGGVSAENLGAKFGGYGSFLPSHQRSPVWTHPRTPQKVHSQNATRSPNNLQPEGRQVDPVHSSTATQSVRIEPISAGSSRPQAAKALFTDDGINQEKCMTSCVEAVTSKYESLNSKSTNFSDLKTLKVRIKMGADSLSTQKNAEIHRLGLNGSPSSSLEDSPLESEGISHEPLGTQYESPISILQIMASFPVLLSPLPNELLQLSEKETCAKDSISVPMHMDDLENYGMLRTKSNIEKNGREVLGGKKMKRVEGYGSSIEVKGSRNKNARNPIGVLSRKERGIDELATEELVSNTLKLPLLSNSYSFVDDSIKGMDGPCDMSKEANKVMVRAKALPDQAQEERLEPSSTEVNGFVEKAKAGAGRNVLGDMGGRSIDDLSIHRVKDNPHGDKMFDSIIAEPPRKAYHLTLPPVKEHSLSGGKKKSKGSYGTVAMKREKEASKVATSLGPKMKKSSDGGSSTSKKEAEDFPVRKNHGEAKDTYRDIFGELEEEEDRTDSLGCPDVDRLKDSEMVERSTSESNYEVKDGSGGKKVNRSSTYEVYPKTATNLVQGTANVHVTEADNVKLVPITATPFVMEDNWVQCDRCQKWRLLPVGTDPDHLPEKWLCSMLNWLPGMNRCSFSEDETTKALIALYQGTAPDSQSKLQVPSVSRNIMQGGALSAVQHPDQQRLNHSLHAMPGGKKKFVRELSHSASKDGSSQLSSSIKKNMQSSVKSRSLNDVNKSPAMSEPDVSGDKHKNKQKVLELNSDRVDTKNVKVKSRRDPVQDCSRPSKKAKTEGMHSTDEECTARKVGHSSNGSFPSNSAGNDRAKVKEQSSSRDSKYEAKDRIQVSSEKSKHKGWGSLDEQSRDLGNYDNTNGVKKRKLSGYHDAETCSTDYHLLEHTAFGEDDFSDCRKEKEARTSKSDVRDCSNSKGSGRTDKKFSHTKKHKLRQDLGSTLSQRSLDGMDCLKRDLESVQEPAAATSSSSKVSGSHKTKVSFQEVKGSPVESVSSSPMRNLNTDKVANREFIVKHDSQNSGAIRSSRICSDAEDDDRSDGPGTARNDKSSNIAHHGSLRSDFQEKDVKLVSDIKSKVQAYPSPDVTTGHFRNGGLETVGQDRTHPTIEQIKDQCLGEGRPDAYCADVSYPRKTERGLSSRFKDNSQGSKSEFDAEMIKNGHSLGRLQDPCPPFEAKQRDGKVKLQEKLGFNCNKSEDMVAGSKGYTGNLSKGSRKKENEFNNGGHDLQEVSVNAMCKPEALSAPSQNNLLDRDAERSSRRSISERIDQEMLGKGKPLSLPPSGRAQNETLGRCPRPAAGFHRENGDMAVDLSKVDDASKPQKKQIRKGDHQSGNQHLSARHPTLNGRMKELDAPSPIRRDSSSHAFTNALREAKDLKHLADRLKHSGSILESTGIYFQAALKFLHAASLLESGNNGENGKMYSSTAKLCEFCAHEYEKSKDMAAAALAYKCTEVAYMRVIYSSHTSASRDRHELQTALQMVPLGESPSSSASDVENVNNSTTAEKAALSKGVASPQVSGSHVITARNRPNFVRLLNFAQDVNFALEASRKSRIAFAAASASLGEAKYAEGISSIKKALDFSFQDVGGLLRLVRLAMEAINR